MKILRTPIRLMRTPGQVRSPMPSLGQHTETILQALGYSTEMIQRLRQQGIIAWESGSRETRGPAARIINTRLVQAPWRALRPIMPKALEATLEADCPALAVRPQRILTLLTNALYSEL